MDIRSFLSPALRFPLLTSLTLGVSNVLAFAPFGVWPLQIATLTLMFWLLISETSIKRGALSAWAYSFGWLAAGFHWLYISLHQYGGLSSLLTVLAVALLAAGLALLIGTAMGAGLWLQQRWHLSKAKTLLLIFPAVWTLGEWTRGWIFTGFPWLSSGYAHNVGPLAGFAPLVGVYGLGFISAIIAGSLNLAPARKPLVLAFAIFFTGFALKTVNWTKPHGQPISVRLLQGNVPQEMKFAAEQIESTLLQYYDMLRAQPADLIATPETAIPLLSRQLPPDYLERLSDFTRQTNSHVLLGIPVSDGPARYANSIITIPPALLPNSNYRYDKHHLVPFGEFIPFGFRWFVNMMHIPLGDFTPGKTLQSPIAIRGQSVLPNICYEDLFGEEIAAQIAASSVFTTSRTPEPTILLNVSNIAWFGNSIALPQHLQISQMRSIETGRPMLRATNTGATAVITPKGEVMTQLEPFKRDTLTAMVQGYRGTTPYILFGNRLIITLVMLSLIAAWLLSRREASKSPVTTKKR